VYSNFENIISKLTISSSPNLDKFKIKPFHKDGDFTLKCLKIVSSL